MKEDVLYFNSAKEGKKCDIFKQCPTVWITFVGQTKIPENYTNDELDKISKDPSKVALLLSSVFTTEYESVMVKGVIKLVEDKDEKVDALSLICKKYTPSKIDYVNSAISVGMARVNIYKIEIKDLTSKRKKYDYEGKEMKWGRMAT